MANEYANHEIRLSDADRERVVDRLRRATDEGRITLTEFEERAGQVYAAKYPSEMSSVTADLPALPTTPQDAVRPARSTEDLHASPAPKQARWSVQIMGGNERRGNWDVGNETKSLTIMGGQVLDLTEVEAQHVTITCFTLMGTTDIVVPDGAKVDMDGFILFGGVSNSTKVTGDSEMTVRIRAYGAMGGCEVRNLSKRQRKKRGLPPA